jgi:NAD(P) transhydrogenase subunit alpha
MILASTLTTNLAILVLAGFIGFVVISKVPNTLHTPLMSGTNAIHGIVLLGGLLIVGLSSNGTFNKVILVIAIAFGTINIVGGFLVTDRMLEMFKSKPKPPSDDGAGGASRGADGVASHGGDAATSRGGDGEGKDSTQ